MKLYSVTYDHVDENDSDSHTFMAIVCYAFDEQGAAEFFNETFAEWYEIDTPALTVSEGVNFDDKILTALFSTNLLTRLTECEGVGSMVLRGTFYIKLKP